jgi:hypothetical protein
MAYLQLKNTINQSIPTATLTELLWPTVDQDDAGFMQAGNIIIPFEGVGQGGLLLQWEPSIAGTYREIIVRAYDTGAEAGGYTDYMKRFEKSVCIKPSADARFCHVTVDIPPFWFAMGYEIRVFAQHDAGGPLNIANATTAALLTITNPSIVA